MEALKAIIETVTKIGSWGVTLGFGSWFLLAAHEASPPNIEEAAVGAFLCVSSLAFDYLVYHAKSRLFGAGNKAYQDAFVAFIKQNPGR